MNLKYVEPFIKASQDMINQVAGEESEIGEIFSRNTSFNGDNVIIIIGVTGDATGQVIFNLCEKSACDIASKMMCGMPVEQLDEMAKSAIGELANMISGNAATIFSSKQIQLDITPPTIMIGEKIEISVTKSEAICVPLLIKNGSSFHINVSLSEK